MEIRGLCKTFAPKAKQKNYAVFDLSLDLREGEILGLVGESGCGKSTLGKLMLRLSDPTRGSVVFLGEDITTLSYTGLRPIRRRMQMVFQGSTNAFNPYYTIRRSLEEPLLNYRIGEDERERVQRIATLLENVGLGAEFLNRYPSELSGGQLQRIGIARALILDPALVVLDEPVSSIDHAVKNQILNLLSRLRDERGNAYLFISHDLESVRRICDRVAVMYLGNLIEIIPRADELPRHPYTLALTAASLSPDPRKKRKSTVLFKEGEEMRISRTGCVFQNRCLHCRPLCLVERPPLLDRHGGHMVACHLEKVAYDENIA
jgi:peptide/nickel transport system ATP-binding protein/oligopeptide transport system ATP-binding protein